MKNISEWKESKFNLQDGVLYASREVGQGSWLMAQLIADKYTEFIPKYVKGRILDLGCGSVPLFGLYKSFMSENICVDWDKSIHQNQYLDISMDISKPLPFPDDSFDTIICSDVLEHIFEPKNVIEEMIRVCKDNGFIILNVPFDYWMHENPYDYNRMTRFFYERFAEESDDVQLVLIKPLGGRIAVLVDKYAKIAVAHRWMLGRTVQRFYYKYLVKKDNADADTLGFFLIYKKI